MSNIPSAIDALNHLLVLNLALRGISLYQKYEEIYQPLKKRGITPFGLSKEKFITKCMENSDKYIRLFPRGNDEIIEAAGLYFNAVEVVDDAEALKYVYEYFNREDTDYDE